MLAELMGTVTDTTMNDQLHTHRDEEEDEKEEQQEQEIENEKKEEKEENSLIPTPVRESGKFAYMNRDLHLDSPLSIEKKEDVEDHEDSPFLLKRDMEEENNVEEVEKKEVEENDVEEKDVEKDVNEDAEEEGPESNTPEKKDVVAIESVVDIETENEHDETIHQVPKLNLGEVEPDIEETDDDDSASEDDMFL